MANLEDKRVFIDTNLLQIHDANIVATMKTYNINKLLTYNIDDFKRFSSIIILL